MKFYADVTVERDSGDIIEELNGLAAQLAGADCVRNMSKDLDVARDGMILSGMLEQALADNLELDGSRANSAHCVLASAQRLSDWWADRLLAPAEVSMGAPALASAANADPLSVVVPEGYLFYALFPEAYAQVGRDLAKEAPGTPFVVVGLRSIGTSLSAAVAAGLRQAGCPVIRHTVRPISDPFSREVVVPLIVRSEWREAADREAKFVAVDEGPGLSGSSLAALVDAFRQAGAPLHRIAMVCANAPGSLPHAGAAVRQTWQSTAFRSVEPVVEQILARRLPALLSSTCNAALHLERDLSWGKWRETEGPLLPRFERRKLLFRERNGGRTLAKFVGFGVWGRGKAAHARCIAESGAAPPFRGYAHGFLLQEWVGEAFPDNLKPSDRVAVVDAAAHYYAGLRRGAGTATGSVDFSGLTTAVEQIRDAWFGPNGAADLSPMVKAAAPASPRAIEGDQRPEPVEWRRWGDRVLKCDTADHFLDHSWARRQDIAFDLAGFVDEWQLTARERERFMAVYMSESGDTGAPNRLPFFRCVYNAHRLAMLDTAYHAGMDDGNARISVKRQAVSERLATALKAPPAATCV